MLKIVLLVLKALLILASLVSFFLAIYRRGMWFPRTMFLLWLLFLYLALPPLQCVNALTILMALWSLILFWQAHLITPLPRNHPEFGRSRLLLLWYIVRRIFSLHPPAYVVEEGRVEERIAGARFRDYLDIAGFIERLFFSNSPVLIRSDSVAILQLFVTPSRLVGNQMVFRPDISDRQGEIVRGTTGPGTTICFLDLYEDVKGVIDLRPQREVGTVKAHSTDNMEVDLRLLIDLSLSRVFQEERLEYVYTYDPAEIVRAFYFQGPGELGTVRWDERFFSTAKAQLSKAVFRHALVDLYNNSHERISSQVLEEDLRGLLRETVRLPGRLNLLRIALVGVTPEAVNYSLRNWEARVKVEEKPREAEAEAAYWRRVSEARIAFLQELIERISEVFVGAKRGDMEIALMMRMSKIVEDLAHSLADKGLLSPEAAKTLERIGVYKALSPGGS